MVNAISNLHAPILLRVSFITIREIEQPTFLNRSGANKRRYREYRWNLFISRILRCNLDVKVNMLILFESSAEHVENSWLISKFCHRIKLNPFGGGHVNGVLWIEKLNRILMTKIATTNPIRGQSSLRLARKIFQRETYIVTRTMKKRNF